MRRDKEIKQLAEDILQEFTNCYSEVDLDVLVKMIQNADVVKVVRCKNCAYHTEVTGYTYGGKQMMHCFLHGRLVNHDGFCDEAVRKNKE